MITFDTAIDTAKNTIHTWSEFSKLSEVTIIRDVFGRLAFLFCGQNIVDKNAIEVNLGNQLGSYNASHFFWEGDQYNNFTQQLLNEIRNLRYETYSEPTCKWYLLERTISKKAWHDYSGQIKPIWPYDDAKDGKKPKVITFYSFKGGMGRTTALAATALLLAKHGRHVLAIDTDIEAPGLATLFFDESQIKHGTVDFYLESSSNGRSAINMSPYFLQVSDQNLTKDMSGSLYIIPAGSVDDQYVQKLGRIDYQDTVPNGMRDNLSWLIESATNFIQSRNFSVDYILLDARAGFHDMGGIVTAQIPHGVVLFGRNNTQSWNGLKQVIQTLANTQEDLLPIAIVDSIADVSEGQRQAFKSKAHTLCCENYYPADEPAPGIDAEDEAHTPIYISYLSDLNEDIRLYSDGSDEQNRRLEQVKSVLFSAEYCEIESRIRQWFGDEETEKEVSEHGTC